MVKSVASILVIILVSLAVGLAAKVIFHHDRPASAGSWSDYPVVKDSPDPSKCKGGNRDWDCYPRVKQ